MDIDALAEKYDWQGFETYLYIFGALGTFSHAQVIEEWTDGIPTVSYVYGKDLISQQRESNRTTYLVDGIGSTIALSDHNGNITDQYTYDVYGNLIGTAGTTQNNYLFTGEQWDQNLNQYYLRQRYYSQETGRFTRKDSHEGSLSHPLTLNKYLYANGNPVINVDPSGLYSLSMQSATINMIDRLFATGYAFTMGVSSILQLQLNPQQQATLSKPRYANYRPFLKTDKQSGCSVADVPRSFGKKFEDLSIDLGELIVSDAWYYEFIASRSWTGFFLMTPGGFAYDFDGRTPGTRSVWEAKLRYNFVVDYPWVPATLNTELSWESSRARGTAVATTCLYQFNWAFSNPTLATRYQVRWGGLPIVHHIPKPN
jgi:RHS repeat-associated protein